VYQKVCLENKGEVIAEVIGYIRAYEDTNRNQLPRLSQFIGDHGATCNGCHSKIEDIIRLEVVVLEILLLWLNLNKQPPIKSRRFSRVLLCHYIQSHLS